MPATWLTMSSKHPGLALTVVYADDGSECFLGGIVLSGSVVHLLRRWIADETLAWSYSERVLARWQHMLRAGRL